MSECCLCCCRTAVPLLSHCSPTAVPLLSHCCPTAVPLLSHCCHTADMLIGCVQSKSPQAVQPHLGKCFDGIRRLEFGGDDPKSPDILAMVSAEGEKVPLGKSLKVDCLDGYVASCMSA